MPTSDVSIQYTGGTFGGSYQQIGDSLHVTSPYGKANALVGKLERNHLAELLLFGLVQAWDRRHRHIAGAKSA